MIYKDLYMNDGCGTALHSKLISCHRLVFHEEATTGMVGKGWLTRLGAETWPHFMMAGKGNE